MLKSTRRPKDALPPIIAKASSTHSLNGDGKGGGNAPTAPTQNDAQNVFIPGKTFLKPQDQLQLTDHELEEEHTRILNANNPHAPQNIARYNNKERAYKSYPNADHLIVHMEYNGYLLYKGEETQYTESNETATATSNTNQEGTPEGVVEEEGENVENKAQKNNVGMRNQFNFSERAAQTLNNTLRERSTNTDPPPRRDFSDAVSQWAIYDAYSEDLQQKERAKEKAKGGTKKEETSLSSSFIGISANGSGNSLSSNTENVPHEDFKNNVEVKKTVCLLERMCNQNSFDDVANDYMYWEDAADEFREGKGVLLPLWKFTYEKDKRKGMVTSLAWNPHHGDLFAVSFGTYDFVHPVNGMIACFSFKNPSYPEMLFKDNSLINNGVMCLDFHPQKPSLIAAGLYDGSIAVYDLSKKTDTPIFRSLPKKGKHSDPVWQVTWQKDDLDENSNFVSISSDGRVTLWTLLKTELSSFDIIKLRLLGKSPAGGIRTDNLGESFNVSSTTEGSTTEETIGIASGTCFDFCKVNPDIFVVGTEDGKIHKCSRAYSSQYLLTYEGHQMAVYAVRYNPFASNCFVSASADWTVKLWEHDIAAPLMVFDLNSSVGDVAWAPYSSSIFGAVTADGKAYIYDINENKNEPICDQAVTKKSKPTHLSFHSCSRGQPQPVLLIGDDRGHVMSFKLSPNLRKLKGRSSEETQEEKIARIVNTVLGRVDAPAAAPAAASTAAH